MLPLLQREVVDHYHWLSNKEFMRSIAIAGHSRTAHDHERVHLRYGVGPWGACGAVIFSYLPSIMWVTIASHYYLKFKNSWIVKASFRGIRPAVIGLLTAVAITLGKASIPDLPAGLIAAATLYTCVYESGTNVDTRRRVWRAH